jgi:hypothetical protein
MDTKIFETPDLYLSAALSLLLEQDPIFTLVNGKILFGFNVNENLYRAMSNYNSGVALNALEFSQAIKRLKSEMLMRRQMGQSLTGVYHG